MDERDEELVGAIDNLGGDERFRFGLDELTRSTGLTRESIVSAKRWLKGRRLINWSGGDGHLGADCLAPNYEFHVVETTTKPGYCSLAFAHD